jgi:hypothetical protein
LTSNYSLGYFFQHLDNNRKYQLVSGQ